ncbi:hypothetical protein HMPREF2690_06405 [Corynebacterium sp. HMSC034E11]|uniref:SLC13 family permease n=1 Tax=Corynebacterium sp. HMSC034E11 TaxID=1715169 RepID=UPI0008A90D6B|nr:SLC13 family permease [Corynebacterium sp. HMSC034E11]OHO33752.1 hypothetical protein HMPREF2690_06405 [Corynebacterium sp. HMSC034E11]
MNLSSFSLPLAAIASLAVLAAVSLNDTTEVALRLVPVLGFAAGMSVVVNLAARVHTFEWLVGALQRTTSRREIVLAGFLALCVAATAFLSLDTTAIILTPLAVQLASRFRLPVPAVALSVVWIANFASMPLPVSNLTNLLAVGGDAFSTTGEYVQLAAAPAAVAVAVAVAVAASYAARAIYRSAAAEPMPEASSILPRPTGALAVLGVTVVALLSPIPYWLTSTVAAIAMWCAVGPTGRRDGITPLIPWSALSLATAFSAVATLALQISDISSAVQQLAGTHPLAIAAAGATTANAINNIPAFLMLEPAVSDPASVLALLIGVNVGPVITPWASLATLLWADQLRRAKAPVPWRGFILWGLLLAPATVTAATAALLAVA